MKEDIGETTLGQSRVRLGFNPNEVPLVTLVKDRTAYLIDQCERGKRAADGEQARLYALAQTAYEEAAMWAVKAATYGL